MAGGIRVAQLSADMLESLAAAHRVGGAAGAAAMAAQMTTIAGELGTSTKALWRGIVVAQASKDPLVAAWAKTAYAGAAGADLGLSGAIVAAPEASPAGGFLACAAAASFVLSKCRGG